MLHPLHYATLIKKINDFALLLFEDGNTSLKFLGKNIAA